MPDRRYPPTRTPLRGLGPLLILTLLLALLVGAITTPAHAATESSGVPGKVRFVKRMDASFDPYVTNTTQAQRDWLNAKFWRMEVFSTFFDSRTSWYPNGWVYSDAYAIYTGGDAIARDQYILRDTAGNRLYIPWGCEQDGGCPQHAADITSPAFRASWIDSLKTTLAKGYRGAWIDDVNLDFRLSDVTGNTNVSAYSPSLGRVITEEDWRKAMATFMEEVRAAVPADKEILHNSIWYAGRDSAGTYFPEVDRQIKAADYINVERGVNDGGLTGGTWIWSLRTLHSYMDKVHGHGKGVVIDAFDGSVTGREYSLANYLLISNGRDGVGEMSQRPDNWWSGWETNLGQPTSARTTWNDLIRRDFADGMVLVNEPQAPSRTVTLPTPMKNSAGQTVSQVTLGAAQGAVLTKIQAAGPVITSMTPATGPATGGTQVVLRGSGLTGADVTVNGTSTASVEYGDDHVEFVTPAGTAGAATVRVVTARGETTRTFTYEAVAPVISGLSVASGYRDADTPVEIRGTRLTGAEVTVGGVAVIPQVTTPTRIVVVLPRFSTAGTRTISVKTASGTATAPFSYVNRTSTSPTITSMSPTRWYWNIATQVTINGTNLSAATLLVNGRTVTPSSRTATRIVALLPVGDAPGTTATITVRNTAGSATTMYQYDPYLGTNVLANGTFESGLSGWSASGATVTSSTDIYRSGTRAMRVIAPSTTAWVRTLSASAPAGRYQASAWVRTAAGVPWRIELTDGSGATHATAGGVGTGAWQYAAVVGTTTSTRAGLRFRTLTTTSATAVIDDVAVQAAS